MNSRRRASLAAWSVYVALCLVPSGTSAQLQGGSNSVASFQFNLSNPGARSLGMGGAFAGLADDATAAYANPAGLTILARPELSLELRDSKFGVPVLVSQFQTTDIRENGTLVGVSLSSGEQIMLGEGDAGRTGASFASYVHPFGRWTLALYRHQLADLRLGVAADIVRSRTGPERIDFEAELDVTGHGVAIARRLTRIVSLGLSVTVYDGEIRSTTRATPEIPPAMPRPNPVEGRWSDDDVVFNAGILARPGDRWSLGAFYRKSPELRGGEVRLFRDGVVVDTRSIVPFKLPDVFGIGGSYRATQELLVTFEWDRVEYSDLVSDEGLLGRFVVDDASELRVGLEYSFLRTRYTPAVRFGLWHDPDHKIRFQPDLPCPGRLVDTPSLTCFAPEGQVLSRPDLANPVVAAARERAFPPGSDELHVTVGFGLVFGRWLQVDAAADRVDSDNQLVSLSGVVRF